MLCLCHFSTLGVRSVNTDVYKKVEGVCNVLYYHVATGVMTQVG
jgi:hypothetical protein